MEKIDLGSFEKNKTKELIVYTGRDLGDKMRKYFELSKKDKDSNQYEIIFPSNIIAISTSFFLALFGDSVRSCSTKEKFENKYIFNVKSNLKSSINDGINDALNNVDGLSI